MKRLLTFVAILVALWLYSGPLRAVPAVYNSPDEQVAAVFLARFAEAGTLVLPHPFSVGAEDEFLHPRSAFADLGRYALPVGFWGLPVLYGSLAQISSLSLAPYFTTFLVIIMAAALRRLWQVVFPRLSSLAAFVITLFFPAVWYYAARPFLPNVPFLALAIIGSVWLITRPLSDSLKKLPKGAPVLDDIIGAGLLGAAFLVRPSEVWWLAAVAAMVIGAYWREVRWQRFVTWAAVLGLTVGFYVLGNVIWYGSAVGGYVVSRSLPVAHWWTIFLPFGFHPRAVLATGYAYGLALWPWLILPALGGLGAFAWAWRKNRLTQAQKVYTAITLVVGAYLWVYYGSWQDTTYGLHTIGVAYARYWLPIFLLLVPYAVSAYQWLAARLCLPRVGLLAFTCVVLAANAWAVYHGPDGLTNLTTALRNGQIERNAVTAITPAQAIIVTEREDKFVWPTRQVMVHLENPRVQGAVAKLVGRGHSVYWLVSTGSEQYSANSIQLREKGIYTREIKKINHLTLYQFTK